MVLSNASAQNAKYHMDAWIRRIVLIAAGKCKLKREDKNMSVIIIYIMAVISIVISVATIFVSINTIKITNNTMKTCEEINKRLDHMNY